MPSHNHYLRTAFTSASGAYVDLLNPQPEQINFYDIAEHLSKLARYSGATPGTFFSVAQHLVLGTEACLLATGDEVLAAYFELHDAHEYLHGDDTTPKKHAFVELARQHYGDVGADCVRETFKIAQYRLDFAIHAAAGLQFPVPSEMQPKIHYWDMRMRETEWRDLMPTPPPWPKEQGAPALLFKIECWSPRDAQSRLIAMSERLLPALRNLVAGVPA